MTQPLISIIIPTFQSAHHLGDTLNACRAAITTFQSSNTQPQEGSVVELIVVDDGSTDQTQMVVGAFPDVKYFYQDNAGPAAARNLGAKVSLGRWLCFTDADCRPQENWLIQLTAPLKDPAVAVVAGSYGIANAHQKLSRCIHQEILFRHRRLPDEVKVFGSYNFLIRREVFEKVKGFCALYRRASGEDNDLSYKIASEGYKIFFARTALVDHCHTAELKKYLAEQKQHGYWRVKMYLDHPGMTRGDGYTFWKDSIEILLAGLGYASFVLIFTGFFYAGVVSLLVGLLGLIAINLYFGFKMIRPALDALYFADVMIARAFARTSGFLLGLLNFAMTFDVLSVFKNKKNR